MAEPKAPAGGFQEGGWYEVVNISEAHLVNRDKFTPQAPSKEPVNK